MALKRRNEFPEVGERNERPHGVRRGSAPAIVSEQVTLGADRPSLDCERFKRVDKHNLSHL
jgi:hypothetical protein